MTKTTDHEERLSTTDNWPRYDSAPFWLTRTRPRAAFNIRGWKVSIVLLSANALWDMFAVNKDVSVRIFWHTSPWLCAVSTIISHWSPNATCLYVTTCKFSLKRRISALVWLTWTPPCATFDICGHVWAESFHCFAHCERTMRCVHCKTTCVYITFRRTKTCICVTINITLCFPPTFPSIYLNSQIYRDFFLLTNPCQYPTINIRNHVWVHWFDWCKRLLHLFNVKIRLSKQNVCLTRSCPCADFHIGERVCM